MKRRTSEKSFLHLLRNSWIGPPILRHGVFIHMENELWNLVSKSCPTWVHEAASSFLMVKNVEFISVPPLSRVGGHRYLRGRRGSTALSVKPEGQAGSAWLGHLGVGWVLWGWVPLKALWGVGVLGQDPETWETRKQDIVFLWMRSKGETTWSLQILKCLILGFGGEVCCFFYGFILQLHFTADIYQI